jgi:hypothetical protein
VATSRPEQTEFPRALGPLQNLAVSLGRADANDRSVLDGSSFRMPTTSRSCATPTSSRASTLTGGVLIPLLDLRGIADRIAADFTIVSENPRGDRRELTRVADVNDIVMSQQVTIYLLGRSPRIAISTRSLTSCFDGRGPRFTCGPWRHVDSSGDASFATLVEAVPQRGETESGYRIAALSDIADECYVVRVNPPSHGSSILSRPIASS